LEDLNHELEARVRSRTNLLELANSELQEKIEQLDNTNIDLKQAQASLIEISRKAGMADIANGVLHNIGNVLNSLNVSAGIVSDRVKGLNIDGLKKVLTLFESKSTDLGTYLISDPKGKLTLPYLAKLAASIDTHREEISQELQSILKHVDHIKDIVRSQQSYAGAFGLIETCEPHALFHDALSFVLDSMQRHNIAIKEDFENVSNIQVERSRLIQVLVNLIKNAKEALLMSDVSGPEIKLRVKDSTRGTILFQVTDNGIGIAAEHLTKIFSQGFTTKASGHGFGLHASANLAKEIGGNLSASSEGRGYGATFTLEVPLVRKTGLGTKPNGPLVTKLIDTVALSNLAPLAQDH
jgi:C4-dicarboxylate-specific signal transduction histidine kinase